MSKFDIAHIKEQGIDLIIIPLKSSFGRKSENDQNQIINELQICASSAGLKGTVVPVWDSGGGRMGFIAIHKWHPYFSSINLNFVHQNINRELACD